MDIHSPQGLILDEFQRHQEAILPITSKYIGRRNLDIGCGNGLTSIILKEKLNIEPTLCDIVDIRDKLASELPFYKIENGKLPFADKSFDSSYLQYVLHHIEGIEKIKQLLKEAARVAHTVILVEEIASFKTNIVIARSFDEKVNKLIHPNIEMKIYRYYSMVEIMIIIKELNLNIAAHEVISSGTEENGFLETHVCVYK